MRCENLLIAGKYYYDRGLRSHIENLHSTHTVKIQRRNLVIQK